MPLPDRTITFTQEEMETLANILLDVRVYYKNKIDHSIDKEIIALAIKDNEAAKKLLHKIAYS